MNGVATSAVAGPYCGGAAAGGLGSYLGALDNGQPNNVAMGIGALGAVGGSALGVVSPALQGAGVGEVLSDGLATGSATVGGSLLDLITNLMNPSPP